MNKKIGKEQYLAAQSHASHPGSRSKEAVELAEYLRDLGYMPNRYRIFIRHRQRFYLDDYTHGLLELWNLYMRQQSA